MALGQITVFLHKKVACSLFVSVHFAADQKREGDEGINVSRTHLGWIAYQLVDVEDWM